MGRALYFPLVNPPISAPLYYVPPCRLWPSGQIKTCVLVGRTKAQAESEEAHMHSSDANPVLVISSLILADRSEILHRLKLVNPQGIFFPSKLLSNALTDRYTDFCCFSDLI